MRRFTAIPSLLDSPTWSAPRWRRGWLAAYALARAGPTGSATVTVTVI